MINKSKNVVRFFPSPRRPFIVKHQGSSAGNKIGPCLQPCMQQNPPNPIFHDAERLPPQKHFPILELSIGSCIPATQRSTSKKSGVSGARVGEASPCPSPSLLLHRRRRCMTKPAELCAGSYGHGDRGSSCWSVVGRGSEASIGNIDLPDLDGCFIVSRTCGSK
jgi:hypothetical protein